MAVGGVNWGLIGLFDLNIVEYLNNARLVQAVYIIIGLASVWSILGAFKIVSKKK